MAINDLIQSLVRETVYTTFLINFPNLIYVCLLIVLTVGSNCFSYF